MDSHPAAGAAIHQTLLDLQHLQITPLFIEPANRYIRGERISIRRA
jgi:hypothetical protein